MLAALALSMSLAPFVFTPGAHAQAVDDRLTFALPDKSFSFRYPKGWQAAQEGGKIHLSSPDGARYMLSRDTPTSFRSGDPTLSADLRVRAESLVKPLLGGAGYAGVKLLNLSAGSGAIFRFRGTGGKGEDDLAEVWFAQIAGHNVTLVQDSTPLPDHVYELTTLLRSTTFGAAAPATSAEKPNRKAKGQVNGEQKRVRPGGAGNGVLSSSTRAEGRPGAVDPQGNGQSGTAGGSHVMERYEGRLLANDVSFVLRINRGGSATADWDRSSGATHHYEGSYTGEDGNYSVKLTLHSSETAPGSGPARLNLTLRSLGGMVTAQYAAGAPPVRDAVALKLMEVDAGDVKLKSSRPKARQQGGNPSSASGRLGRGVMSGRRRRR